MNNKVQLYLDPDDMHLAYIDNNGVPQRVLTDAFIKDGTIQINDGYLEYKDENNNWHAVLGSNDVPVSLIGPEGPTGIKGDKGDPGDPGKVFSPQIDSNGNLSWKLDDGSHTPNVINILGKKGATFVPTVSAEGEISWTNDGDLPNPPAINIKGENGFTPKIDIDSDGILSVSYKYDYVPSSEPQKVNIKGPKGEDGATFIPKIDKDGFLTWENNKGLSNPESVAIKGQAGLTPKIELDNETGTLSVSYSSDFIPDTSVQSMSIKGPRGEDGKTIVPHVSDEGVLTWSQFAEIPLEPINIKGPKGNDGIGFETEFPANPKLGDTFTWGGESGLNENCFLGYVMTGQQYVYSQLPSKLGLTFANEKTCLIPMHLMLYIPDLLQTKMMSIGQFNKTEQIYPLTFNDNDELIESVTTTTNTLGNETKYMSWAVSYGLTDSQIKHLQPYIINIAKSVFGSKVSEYTTNYASPHLLPKYLQGSAMKCKYSDFSTGGTIFNKLFTFLQENPSNIFTGLQQAIADKLAENDTYDPDVYIIPIQAVPDTNLSKSWISEMPELAEGWAPCDSVLHNGFNTNQVGSFVVKLEIGDGEVEM